MGSNLHTKAIFMLSMQIDCLEVIMEILQYEWIISTNSSEHYDLGLARWEKTEL